MFPTCLFLLSQITETQNVDRPKWPIVNSPHSSNDPEKHAMNYHVCCHALVRNACTNSAAFEPASRTPNTEKKKKKKKKKKKGYAIINNL